MKPRLSESEQYYARKNRRREWWGKHWDDFIMYPVALVVIVAIIVGAFYLLSIVSFKIGKDHDMKVHPQDWQHWHWHYHTNFNYTNIYNRS